jgi:hypothetical protein
MMDEDRKRWYEQYSKSFGAEEFLRFGCAFIIWNFIGLGMEIWLHNIGVFEIFLAIASGFPILAVLWNPAYFLFRKILGGKNMPTASLPINQLSQSVKLWFYLSLVLIFAIPAVLFYTGVRSLLTK